MYNFPKCFLLCIFIISKNILESHVQLANISCTLLIVYIIFVQYSELYISFHNNQCYTWHIGFRKSEYFAPCKV